MDIPLLDLRAQYEGMKDEIDGAVGEVLSQAAFIGGPRVKAIEEAIAEYCGVSHGVACGNGTDALFLILAGLGIKLAERCAGVPNNRGEHCQEGGVPLGGGARPQGSYMCDHGNDPFIADRPHGTALSWETEPPLARRLHSGNVKPPLARLR